VSNEPCGQIALVDRSILHIPSTLFIVTITDGTTRHSNDREKS
jgi:hypothetical protein